MYYKICESCGAVLDPGEKCDCETRETITEPEQAAPENKSEVIK